ncbi:MAG: hypothetical protein K5751_06345 [Treponemataceae bacterium]|nr:hypothetical protein [Treponemataceae bacterium]
MDNKTLPAAEKLKTAIDKYGKENLYKELPDYIKEQYKPESFNQKINKLHGDTFFTDSKLLYEILRCIGVSYESLFNPESEESRIAFYLNKINENIAALKDEQKLNNWFENNSTIQKKPPRTTPIKKLNNVLSIWYIYSHLIPEFKRLFNVPNTSEELIYGSGLELNLSPYTSDLFKNICSWNINLNHSTPDDIFLHAFKVYGSEDRAKLNLLFALVGTNDTQIPSTSLSLLGANYLLIYNLQNYYNSFDVTPFQEGVDKENGKTSDLIYKQIKTSLSTILRKFDEVIDFIDIRSQVSAFEKKNDAIEDSIDQLIKTENFIFNRLFFHYLLWKMYITSIENEILQQNDAQVRNLQAVQDTQILDLIKELKAIDFRSQKGKNQAIELLRFRINEMCTGSPFGFQLITPMSKLHYERMMSNKLERLKLPVPKEPDSITHFENSIIGYLERFKKYRIK